MSTRRLSLAVSSSAFCVTSGDGSTGWLSARKAWMRSGGMTQDVKACREQDRYKEGAGKHARVRARNPGPAHVCSAASAGDDAAMPRSQRSVRECRTCIAEGMARGHSYVNKQKGRAKESGYRASVVAWLRALPHGMHFSKVLYIVA